MQTSQKPKPGLIIANKKRRYARQIGKLNISCSGLNMKKEHPCAYEIGVDHEDGSDDGDAESVEDGPTTEERVDADTENKARGPCAEIKA